jgi:hypothetical protein
MPLKALVAHTSFDPDGYRIPIPKHLSDRLSWLSGSQSMAGWLWMISGGRYRLLSDEQVKADPYLDPLRTFLLEQQLSPSVDPSASSNNEDASLIARLQPVELKLNQSYWRLSFPAVLNEFVPSGCDQKRISFILPLDGYLEVWYTETLRAAVFQSGPR